jgi:hypothetical protein
VFPRTAAQLLKDSKDSTDESQCRLLREEVLEGEPSVVYEVRRQALAFTGEWWISKRSGLLLKQEILVGAKNDPEHSHMSLRVDYQNVKAPVVGK